MILPMLMNIALGTGKLEVEADARNYRLVTRAFGMTITLAKLDKEAVYQLTRTPDMPATRDGAAKGIRRRPEGRGQGAGRRSGPAACPAP
ncbi:hypothetical protein U8P73_36180 (plasmid) [Rhizobium beringeri]|uniref:hypothetical protein n=1 Tax=Rhizobium beringeri TaxID=3019934 RepID=UPI002DDCE791|nr:hypothetical protein [Rhizobium beringeri]WSG93589.1 hypothetical protein U8P73_36180 [Rhizobium beringeri]